MGAMKSLLADDDRSDLLTLCTGISRARDEYREELFRERELTRELLRALKDAEKHCGVIPLNTLQELVRKAEGRP